LGLTPLLYSHTSFDILKREVHFTDYLFFYMSVIKHAEQRVAIFIDTQNLYHSAKNIYKAKVNFGEVVRVALKNRKLIRAVAYVVTTESGEEQSFFEALEKIGIEVKTKDLQIFFGGAKKADWDVGLAVDAIKHSQKVDAIVLATGDGDFVPLVEYVRSQGCQVECISFGKSSSGRLRDCVDDFIDMDEDPHAFLIGVRGGNRIKKKLKQIVGTDTDDI